MGTPFTRTTIKRGGTGGSEVSLDLLAHALAEAGKSVLCLNRIDHRSEDDGVIYDHHANVPIATRALVISRYSSIPKIHAGKVVVSLTDVVYGENAHQYGHDFTFVGVSNWHVAPLPPSEKRVVIPALLSDTPYTIDSSNKVAGRFIYASAALKGLAQTLQIWSVLRQPGMELCVTTPGYDMQNIPWDMLKSTPQVKWMGVLSPEEMIQLTATCEGLFYVNVFEETFCAVAAIAEAVGCRTHIFCPTGKMGALPEVVWSPPPTPSFDEFSAQFKARDYPIRKAPDRRVSALAHQWLEVIS